MPSQENIKLNEELEAALNSHDLERLKAVMSDDVVFKSVASPDPIRGKEAIANLYATFFQAFPDWYEQVESYVAGEDEIAVEIEFGGTHSGPLVLAPDAPPLPPTGKRFAVKGAYFLRIRDGKVTEIRAHPDMAGFLGQLGIPSQPAAS